MDQIFVKALYKDAVISYKMFKGMCTESLFSSFMMYNTGMWMLFFSQWEIIALGLLIKKTVSSDSKLAHPCFQLFINLNWSFLSGQWKEQVTSPFWDCETHGIGSFQKHLLGD